MKMKKIFTTLLVLSSPVVSADERDMSEFSKQIDSIRGQIDYWHEMGNLESTRKNALEDMLEVLTLEAMVDEAKGVRRSSGSSNGETISPRDFYHHAIIEELGSELSMDQQEDLLSSHGEISQGSSASSGGTSNHEIEALRRQQQSFFQQVQDYLSEMTPSQAASSMTDEQLADMASIQEEDATFTFQDMSDFKHFSAKIAGRTQKTVDLAFAISVTDSLPAYLIRKISVDEEEFELHFFGVTSFMVKVVSVNDDHIVLDIAGNRIIAR
ncbi:exported hypothetical protein [Vibrio chagasii]|nr:exported hypothetical protein [Vibrio chagasii]